MQVVLQRATLRARKDNKEEDQDSYHLQLVQLVAVAVLLVAV